MRKFIIPLAIVALLTAALVMHFEWRQHYRCNACLSTKTITEWRLGTTPLGYPLFGEQSGFTERSIRISEPVETFAPSVAVPLFPPEHRHTWVFAQGSPYYLFGTRWSGCLLGEPRQVSPFAYAFLYNPAFRAYTEDAIRAGTLSQPEAVALFAFQPGREGKKDPRFARGVRLVRQFQVTHPNRMFDETFESAFGGS